MQLEKQFGCIQKKLRVLQNKKVSPLGQCNGDAIVIFNNIQRSCETVETIYKNKKARQSAERSQDELKRNAFLTLKNFQVKASVFLTLKNFHLKIGRQVDLVSLQQQFDLLLPCPLPVGPGRKILFFLNCHHTLVTPAPMIIQ